MLKVRLLKDISIVRQIKSLSIFLQTLYIRFFHLSIQPGFPVAIIHHTLRSISGIYVVLAGRSYFKSFVYSVYHKQRVCYKHGNRSIVQIVLVNDRATNSHVDEKQDEKSV